MDLAHLPRAVPKTRRTFGSLSVESFANRAEMSMAAAADVAAALKNRLLEQAGVRMIFAAAPSQADMLEALCAIPGID